MTVRTYPVVLGVTVVVGWAVSLVLAARLAHLPPARVLVAQGLTAVGALAGARLHYVLAHPTSMMRGWHGVTTWEGGVHAAGGLVGLALALPAAARLLGLPWRVLADVTAPAAAISLALARVGCLARGCCVGLPCSGGWCLTYPPGSMAFVLHQRAGLISGDAATSLPVHPLPLYSLAAALAIALLAIGWYRHRRYDGEIALGSLLLFAIATLGLEPYRAPTPQQTMWGPWPQLTTMAALLAVAALLGMAAAELRRWGRGRAP